MALLWAIGSWAAFSTMGQLPQMAVEVLSYLRVHQTLAEMIQLPKFHWANRVETTLQPEANNMVDPRTMWRSKLNFLKATVIHDSHEALLWHGEILHPCGW